MGFWGRDKNALSWGPKCKPVDNWTSTAYFNTTKNDELMPIIYYMDCQTGRLYCSNMKYSGKRWVQYDFNTERNGQNDGGLDKHLRNADFKKIYVEANTRSFKAYKPEKSGNYRTKGISNPPDPSVYGGKDQTLEQRAAELDMTDNGIVRFTSR